MKKFLSTLMLVAAMALTWNIQAQSLSYTCTFENDADTADWVFANGTQANQWVIGDATANGGTKSLYITNGSGAAYNTGSTTCVYAYHDFSISSDGTVAVQFDWKAVGESSYDCLKAFIVPDSSVTFTAGSYPAGTTSAYSFTTASGIAGWYGIGGKLNQQSSWQSVTAEVDLYAGDYKLVFIWVNDGSGGTSPAACVDNVTVAEVACPLPTGLASTAILSDQIDLTWNHATATSFTVEYDTAAFVAGSGVATSTTVSTNSVSLTNLDPNTVYYVAITADCGGSSSLSINGQFRTACSPVPIDSLPYTENFDSYGSGSGNSISPCWTRHTLGNTSTQYPYPYSYNAISGNSLYAYSYTPSSGTGYYSWAALPLFEEDLTSLMLSFDCRRYTYTYQYYTSELVVGVMSDPNDITTFDTMQVVDLFSEAAGSIHHIEVPFSTYEGEGLYIAFYFPKPTLHGSTYCYNYNYVDNVMVDYIPDCPRVTNLTLVDATNADSVTVTWTEVGSASAWDVFVAPTGNEPDENSTFTTVYDTMFVGMFSPDTTYDMYVRANCGGDASYWNGPVTFTPAAYFMNGVDTIRTCAVKVFDDGGLGSYGSNRNDVLVIYPNDPSTQTLQISGTSYTESSYDYIRIYDGVGTTGTQLWNDYGVSSTQTFGPFVSETGALTITFVSDGSVQYDGFELTVRCVTLSECPRPLSVTANNTTSTSTEITVGMDEESTVGSWNIEYGISGFEEGQGTSIVATSFPETITGLTPNTDYDIYVKSICGNDSSWSRMITIHTLQSCPQINALHVSDVRPSSAYFNWTYQTNVAEFNPDNYVLTITNLDNALLPAQVFNVSGLDTAIGGLIPSTHYEVSLVPQCDTFSRAAAVETFVTTPLGCTYSSFSGEGTSSISGACVTSGWGNTFAQQIYTAAELTAMGLQPGLIGGMAFNWTASGSYDKVFSIYIGQVAQSQFAGTTAASWVSFDSLHLVYGEASHPIGTSGVVEYTFDSAFVWDGVSNICVATFMNQPTGATHYSTGFNSYSTQTSGYQTLYKYQDSNPLTPAAASASASGRTQYRANVYFFSCDSTQTCTRPAVYCSSTTSSSLDLYWIAGYDETAWKVEYKTVDDSVYTTAIASTTNNNFALTNLNANTVYDVLVSSLCSDTAVADHKQFRTACGPMALPVTMDFEGMSTGVFDQPCYVAGALDPSVTDYAVPYVIRLTGATNQYALFWQGGYFIMPEVASPLSSCQLRFAMVAGDTNAYMYVGYTTDGTVNGFVAIDTVYRSSADSLTSTSYFTIPLTDVTEAGARVMFFSNQSVNYTFIDDVVIELIPSCAAAANVTASNITDVTVDLAWDNAGSLATSYIVEYGPRGFVLGTGTTVATTTNSYTISGLTPGTVYQAHVYTVCAASGDTSSATPACLFQTGCGEIQSFPYVMDFDNVLAAGSGTVYGALPNCWNLAAFNSNGSNTSQPRVYNTSSYASSGEYVLYMYYTSHVALPAMGIPVDSLQISFSAVIGSASYGLEIGVCDTNVIDSTYVPLDTVFCTATYTRENHTRYLSAYQGTGKYIILHNLNTYGYNYSYVYLDDVTVDRTPSCLPTQNFAVTGNTASSLTLGWSDLRPATEWEIAMDTVAGFTPISGTVVNTNPYTFNGLNIGQDYYFYIRTICQAGDTSAWVGPVHGTPGTWTMRFGQTDTLHMCGGVILDNGGDGDYLVNANDVVIIYPETANQAVNISGSFQVENSFEHIYIYEGAGVTGTQLGSYTGSGSLNHTSEATDGAITLKFTSDGSVVYTGFAFNISCVSNTCPSVGNIAAVGASTTSLDVDWTERGTAAQWEVEYGAAGFSLGTGTRATVTAHPYTVGGLLQEAAYDFYVRPICAEGDTGGWASATLNTSFCDNSVIAAFGGATGTSTYMVPVNNFYNNSTTEVILDSASLGGANSFSAVKFYFDGSYASTNKTDVNIYIQPTAKSTFASASDYDLLSATDAVLVYSGDLNAVSGWNTFMFDTAYDYNGNGNLMMIIYDYSGDYDDSECTWRTRSANGNVTLTHYSDGGDINPTTFTGSGSYTSTEVLAYYPDMQLIACGSGCAAPAIQGVTDVTYEGATISWSGSATSYEVAVVETSNANWPAEVTVMGTSYTFTGLMPSTSYTFRVRGICDTTGSSSWREGTFTTDSLPCFVPTNVTASNATVNSITIAWTNDAQSVAQAWVVNVFNSTTNIIDTVRTNPATITGLFDNTQYSVAVQSMCSSIISSDWSDTITFSTTSCQSVSNVQVGNITTSGATVTWNAGAGQNSWEVNYGRRGFGEGQGTIATVTTTTYQITGLEEEEDYDVYVRAKCAEGIYSDWSPVQQFTTQSGGGQGIDGVEGNYSLSIYPNPAAGNTTISLRGIEGEVTITVVDMNGRTISSDVLNCGADCVKSMNVEGLAQGTYFVRVLGNGINSVRKLIVR